MISHRFAPITAALLGLALVPTVIHSYRGITIDDGLRVSAIPEVLAGAPSKATDRRARWVESNLAATDWIERNYRLGAENVRLFAARSYDPKRLYHHPELAVLRGTQTASAGRTVLPGRAEVPVHLLRTSRGSLVGFAAYVLHYDGEYVANPLRFQVRTAGELLFSGRRAMTLILASDLSGADTAEGAPDMELLRMAVEAFEGTGGSGD